MSSRILIVDPEEVVRRALCSVLRQDAYEIIEAANGAKALAMLQGRPVDLIITAYRMSGMDGVEFLRRVRDELKSDALRIILTAHADLDVAVDAINAGVVYRFLIKPWDDFDLRVMVKLALRRLAALREAERLAGPRRS